MTDWAKYPLEVMARDHVLNDEEVRLMCAEISALRAERDALICAAYEVAARKAYLHNLGRDYEISQRQISAIRALTPDDARAALDRMLAEARREGWDAAKEAGARISEAAYYRNKTCPPGCQCGDGYHIAIRIRAMPYDKEAKE